MKRLITICAVVTTILAGSNQVFGGLDGLDKNSSNVTLGPGGLDISNGNYVTTSPWNVDAEFQISLMGEAESPPNAEWNFNHYDPGGLWDWTENNFADYPYYHLESDSTGGIEASFYTGGATGEMLEWALYYTDSTGSIQTVLGGDLENPSIDGTGVFTAFLRVSPERTYRTFDGTGEGFVNTVEIFNGLGKITDLAGLPYQPGGKHGFLDLRR